VHQFEKECVVIDHGNRWFFHPGILPEIPDLARFRSNIFADRQGPGAVFRVIPSKILTAEQLGLSPHILQLCGLSKGLVLVTGPTGSGKSTTLCAMIDHVNSTRNDHIITIEDPIEFVHENKSCAINQREVHNHTSSFKAALRGALREDPGVAREGIEDAPIVKFVNLLIAQAVADRASDIHVEPTETDLRIRFRVDGVLHEVMHSPRSIQGGVISRLKVMADINIAERRIPQDGRISLSVAGKGVDLRVATLPTVYGEKVVMRILDKAQARLSLPDLGFHPAVLPRFEACFRKPYGTILVTGPTGSGKSTTLYATLNVLNSTDKNVITVEDPVEYRLPGVNQVQVNPKAGLTFASALRSILRSDPDIVLVGEIRDRETATIAIEASLTGHLVLSTLHTNDAASTPMRLVEMGVEPFLVISALDCVVAQRLARKLCERCREEYEPTQHDLAEAGWPAALLETEGAPTLYRAVGCAACSRTGYRGRLAVHEVMVMSEEIRRMVVERYSSDDIKKTALAQGMLTLREDGLVKVAQGKTTLEELFRVIA